MSSSPVTGIAVSAREAHVWFADIEPNMADEGVLAADERERAARMSEQAALHFVASRAALRKILAAYLSAAPAELRFATRCEHCGDASHGKPSIAWPQLAEPPHFSLSRTSGKVAVAVARRPVGVDVERTRERAHLAGVARRAMSERERKAAPTAEVPIDYFYRLWTGKEAYLKAIGWGLVRKMSDVTLLGPDHEGWSRVVDSQEAEPLGWVTPLEISPGFAASLAVIGDRVRVRQFHVSQLPAATNVS